LRRSPNDPDGAGIALEIVPLEADDGPDAVMLRRAALWERLPWLRDVHTPQEDEHYWRTHLLENCVVLGASIEGRLAGVIAYDENWVEQLYVLPGFQGGRIGSSLLDRAKQAADELRLWTFQKNTAARGFYERQGFIAEKKPTARVTRKKSRMCFTAGSGFPNRPMSSAIQCLR
jgi:GNAT superfamily N-acetyltransferase